MLMIFRYKSNHDGTDIDSGQLCEILITSSVQNMFEDVNETLSWLNTYMLRRCVWRIVPPLVTCVTFGIGVCDQEELRNVPNVGLRRLYRNLQIQHFVRT